MSGVSPTRRPRVSASSASNGLHMSSLDGWTRVTPAVVVKVEFDLHDHDEALAVLRRVVADVEAQIEDAR